MIKKFSIAFSICVLTAFASGCQQSPQANLNSNANSNPSDTTATVATRIAPDNSEITTTTDAAGITTETRVFHSNPRVAKVVVTSHNGTHSAKAYSPTGEERELNKNEAEKALDATGNAIADAAGFIRDKAGDAASATKEGAEKVGEKTADTAKTVGEKTADTSKKVAEKTVDTAKTVGEKTGDTAKAVGEKTAEGAKEVGEKTKEGAKKAGKAIKRAVTP